MKLKEHLNFTALKTPCLITSARLDRLKAQKEQQRIIEDALEVFAGCCFHGHVASRFLTKWPFMREGVRLHCRICGRRFSAAKRLRSTRRRSRCLCLRG